MTTIAPSPGALAAPDAAGAAQAADTPAPASTTSTAPASAPSGNDAAEGATATHEEGRSGFTAALTGVAVIGGAIKSVVLDRARVLVAYPHARANGRTGLWAAQLATAKITKDVVPLEGGTVRMLGRTLTTNGWKYSYQATNLVNLGMLAVGLSFGIPNLVEGWQDGDGPAGLYETKHGRTGVMGTAGTFFQLGVMATAAATVQQGNRFTGMLKSPLMASAPVVITGIALGIPVALNELGFFDNFNKGNDDSFAENAGKTLDRHWATITGLPGSIADGVAGVLGLGD